MYSIFIICYQRQFLILGIVFAYLLLFTFESATRYGPDTVASDYLDTLILIHAVMFV